MHFNRSKITNYIISERSQFKALLLLLIIALFFAVILILLDPFIFQRFLGNLNPGITVPGIIAIGFLLLSLLLYKGWFIIYKRDNLSRLLKISLTLVLFTTISILIDLKVGYSEDINIRFPKSLLFYPLIGLIVEIIFHLIPITLVMLLARMFREKENQGKAILLGFILIAIIEPTYQVYFMESFPFWAVLAIWINLFVFNIFQLQLLRKYDFISMYLFRLIYYALWHVLWGYLRLDLIF